MAVAYNVFVVLMLVGFIPLLVMDRHTNRTKRLSISWQATLLLAACLSVTVVVTFFVSLGPMSIFVERYLIGQVIAVAVYTAYVLQAVSIRLQEKLPLTLLLLAYEAAFVLAVVHYDLATIPTLHGRYIPDKPNDHALLELLPHNQPIIVERFDHFDKLVHYYPTYPWVYVLDWQAALDSRSNRNEVTGFHMMEKWRDNSFYTAAIRDVDSALRARSFIVVDEPGSIWFDTRVVANRSFSVVRLGQVSDDTTHTEEMTLWEVTRLK